MRFETIWPLPVVRYPSIFLLVVIPVVVMHVIAIQRQYPVPLGGTPIGDMTANGNLVAAFDGQLHQSHLASAAKNNALTAYIGKDWGPGNPVVVSGFRAWGSIGSGFNAFASNKITLTLQGSTDNFSDSVVDLGTITFIDPNDSTEKLKLTGIVTDAAYRYHRLAISKGGIPNHMYASEVIFQIMGE